MKAISIKQPWAWAIFYGKDVENRVWGTKYRGELLIHASLTFDYDGLGWLRKHKHLVDDQIIPTPCFSSFEMGFIIGKVTMTGCVIHSSSPWFFGPYGFTFENPVLFKEPIPYRGKLKIFDVPGELITECKYRVDCCNGECGWTGYSTECVTFKHGYDLLCPECHEVAEPAPPRQNRKGVFMIKWIDNIITGMNTPDASGYAIVNVNNGIVESLPIPSEFNTEIKELLSRLAAGEEAERSLRQETARLNAADNRIAELEKEVELLKGFIKDLKESNEVFANAVTFEKQQAATGQRAVAMMEKIIKEYNVFIHSVSDVYTREAGEDAQPYVEKRFFGIFNSIIRDYFQQSKEAGNERT